MKITQWRDFVRAGAFGEAFALLVSRRTEAYRSLAETTDEGAELERARRKVAACYDLEAEALITEHRVPHTVAEYVRHVLRDGLEVDFDPMDPPG